MRISAADINFLSENKFLLHFTVYVGNYTVTDECNINLALLEQGL